MIRLADQLISLCKRLLFWNFVKTAWKMSRQIMVVLLKKRESTSIQQKCGQILRSGEALLA